MKKLVTIAAAAVIGGSVCYFQFRSRPGSLNPKPKPFHWSSPNKRLPDAQPSIAATPPAPELVNPPGGAPAEIERAINSKDPKRLAEALTALLNLEQSELRTNLLRQLFAAWAKIDPGEALAKAAGLPTGINNFDLQNLVLQTWAVAEPTAAWEWAKAAPIDGPFDSFDAASRKRDRLYSMLDALGQSNQFAVAAELATEPGADGYMATHLGKAWAAEDPDSAINWAQGIAPGTLRANALLGVLRSLTKIDLEQTTSFALQQPTGLDRMGALVGIHSTFAEIGDRQKEQSWLLGHSTEQAFDFVRAAFVGDLNAPNAALGAPVLAQIVDSRMRNTAASSLTVAFVSTDPSQSLSIALEYLYPNAVPAPSQVRTYFGQHPDEIARFLASKGIPGDVGDAFTRYLR